MKTNSWLALALTLFSLGARGQVAPPSNGREGVLVETGPNHQVWQGLTVDEQGRTNVSSITELATGMNYWDGQQWTPSDAAFDAADDGFLASRVQHPVHLLSN